MANDFCNETMDFIANLEQAGYSAYSVHIHRLCLNELQRYLMENGAKFSRGSAIGWLESRKLGWKHGTYRRYRVALYRFINYSECGNTERIRHSYSDFYEYHDAGKEYTKFPDSDVNYVKLTDDYKMLVCELYETALREHNPSSVKEYFTKWTDFLLFVSVKGCASPSELTIHYLLEYSHKLRESQLTTNLKSKHVSGVNFLLKYFHEQGCIPRCYLPVLCSKRDNDLSTLKPLANGNTGTAFQPSRELEPKADEFLSKLECRCYSNGTIDAIVSVLNEFFRFLEISRIEYSPDASRIWLNNLANDAALEKRRPVIKLFDDFMLTGNGKSNKKERWKPILFDSLPDWSRSIAEGFLLFRKREGWTDKTIVMGRASCVRFFGFLNRKGVTEPSGITPELVKEFHDTDPHTTPNSRGMYGSNIRKLLMYMAESELVPQNLYHAISSKCAPNRYIVTVLTPEMESAIYEYREKAKSPIELRNAAVVMLGLRMGLRASDIVNLKISDFDWKNSKLSIIQSKTRKAVTLPVPIDAGNSVYKYILQGRPQTGSLGTGYVFISHRAPYSELSHATCVKSLKGILSEYDLKLPPGQGFHITRKTYATKLLIARTNVDAIADALGHTRREALNSYLAHDEDGMRLCPLPFAVGGAL